MHIYCCVNPKDEVVGVGTGRWGKGWIRWKGEGKRGILNLGAPPGALDPGGAPWPHVASGGVPCDGRVKSGGSGAWELPRSLWIRGKPRSPRAFGEVFFLLPPHPSLRQFACPALLKRPFGKLRAGSGADFPRNDPCWAHGIFAPTGAGGAAERRRWTDNAENHQQPVGGYAVVAFCDRIWY